MWKSLAEKLQSMVSDPQGSISSVRVPGTILIAVGVCLAAFGSAGAAACLTAGVSLLIAGQASKATVQVAEAKAASAIEPDRRFFEYAHLPPHLQETSRSFSEQADRIYALPPSNERAAALRRLLESKDAAVRAALPPKPQNATQAPEAPVTVKPVATLDPLDPKNGG